MLKWIKASELKERQHYVRMCGEISYGDETVPFWCSVFWDGHRKMWYDSTQRPIDEPLLSILVPDESLPGSAGMREEKAIVGKDMICPVSKEHCDDETCTTGSECNMSGNSLGPVTSNIQDPLRSAIENWLQADTDFNNGYTNKDGKTTRVNIAALSAQLNTATNELKRIARQALSSTGGEKWVSVEDRLPDAEGRYLCGTLVKLVTEDEPIFNQYVSNFNFYRDSKTGERIMKNEDGAGCFQSNAGYAQIPTHWQPLPPSPSKQQQK